MHCRLAPIWRRLHRHVLQQYESVMNRKSKGKTQKQITNLLRIIQCKLQFEGISLAAQKRYLPDESENYCNNMRFPPS